MICIILIDYNYFKNCHLPRTPLFYPSFRDFFLFFNLLSKKKKLILLKFNVYQGYGPRRVMSFGILYTYLLRRDSCWTCVRDIGFKVHWADGSGPIYHLDDGLITEFYYETQSFRSTSPPLLLLGLFFDDIIRSLTLNR